MVWCGMARCGGWWRCEGGEGGEGVVAGLGRLVGAEEGGGARAAC